MAAVCSRERDIGAWFERLYRLDGPPTLRNLAWFYHGLLGALYFQHFVLVGMLLFVVPLLIWCARTVRGAETVERDNDMLLQFLPQVTVPVMATFLLAYFGTANLFADRVLIFAVMPYCLLIATALSRIQVRTPRMLLSGALLVWTASATVTAVDRVENSGTRWKGVANCVAESGGSSVPVRAVERFVAAPYAIYLQMSGAPTRDVGVVHSFRDPLPDRFWAAYRVLRASPRYSNELTSDLDASGYVRVKRCVAEDDRNDFHVYFDLEDRTAIASKGRL